MTPASQYRCCIDAGSRVLLAMLAAPGMTALASVRLSGHGREGGYPIDVRPSGSDTTYSPSCALKLRRPRPSPG